MKTETAGRGVMWVAVGIVTGVRKRRGTTPGVRFTPPGVRSMGTTSKSTSILIRSVVVRWDLKHRREGEDGDGDS